MHNRATTDQKNGIRSVRYNGKKRCPCCKRWYHPKGKPRDRQKYCGRPVCQQKRRRVSKAELREKTRQERLVNLLILAVSKLARRRGHHFGDLLKNLHFRGSMSKAREEIIRTWEDLYGKRARDNPVVNCIH
jgi:hypothetical protein